MRWKKFIDPTLWAIWGLVVGGAGLWAIVGSIGYFNKNGWLPSEAAGWAQAVGAGLAIIAASFIPIWHSDVATRRKQKNLLGVMRVLSDEALEKLWLLTNSFIDPLKATRMMRDYLFHKREQDWSGLSDAISKIPIAELPPENAKALGDLRDAVAFAQRVAGELPDWANRGYAQPGMLVALRAKRDLLSLSRNKLPHVDGVTVPGKVDAQLRGEPHELHRPFLEPFVIRGVKVFRSYVWNSDEDVVPISAFVQCLFPYANYDCELEIVHATQNWSSLAEAERYIRGYAEKKIGDDVDWNLYFKNRG